MRAALVDCARSFMILPLSRPSAAGAPAATAYPTGMSGATSPLRITLMQSMFTTMPLMLHASGMPVAFSPCKRSTRAHMRVFRTWTVAR